MSTVTQKIADSCEIVDTGMLHGWTVEYERPWWHADKNDQHISASTKALIMRAIARRRDAE